jgi:CheY-like chemotaxis protein
VSTIGRRRRKSWDKLSEVPAHRSFRVGRKHLPHDTFDQFISGRASQYVPGLPHQALVMKKATRAVAKLAVVIDDDPLILEATGGLLQSWGCCVVTAQSCEEALVRLAKTQAGRRPDCDHVRLSIVTRTDRSRRHRFAARSRTRFQRFSSAPMRPALLGARLAPEDTIFCTSR